MGHQDGLQKGAMFMAGLTLLQSLRVALTGAKFALDRFKIPQQYASSFINMVHNPMELATFTGMAIVTVTALCVGGSNEGFKWFAVFTNMTLCYSFILLLYAFTSGGEQGDLTFYYWVIVFGSFIYGLNVAAVMTVASADASLFNMGIPISGILVCIYYYVFTKLAEWCQWSKVSYKIIVWQLIIAIVIAAASAALWIGVACNGTTGDTGAPKEELGKGLSKAVSPILMGMVGMGGIYAFYPAIAPYKLTDVGTGYKIDLVVLFMSAVPGIIIAILCLNTKGPDKNWRTNNAQWWHYVWVLAIPHILAMVLCFVTLHYPNSGLATSIKSSGLNVGIITVTLKFCEEGLKAVSYAGGGKQVGKYCSCPCQGSCPGSNCTCPCKESNGCQGCRCCQSSTCKTNCICGNCTCKCCKEREGTYSSVNAFTSQGLMIILAFTGDGYLKTYSKYEHDRSKWPTKNYGTLRSILYWTKNGIKVACKSVKSSFTKNVRCKVLGKSEALLIVYADEEF